MKLDGFLSVDLSMHVILGLGKVEMENFLDLYYVINVICAKKSGTFFVFLFFFGEWASFNFFSK